MIGDLYDANNVKVGQAACLIAPANTPLPVLSATVPNMSDPFDLSPWTYAKLAASATITAGSYTLTYTFNGTPYTTAAIQYTDVAATIKTALLTALAPLGVTSAQLTVTGGPPNATTTPVLITLDEAYVGGTWSVTPTGITGGTLSITPTGIWTPVGATDQGWTWNSAKTLQDITIEEQSTLVGRFVANQQFQVTAALSEDITRTLATVHNMTRAFTAASVSNPAYETLTLTDSTLQYAVALIMQNTLSYPRWLYIPATTCLDNVSTPLRRAAAKRMYTATFTSVCATSAIQVFEFEAPHS
jgi:hypothetical protein